MNEREVAAENILWSCSGSKLQELKGFRVSWKLSKFMFTQMTKTKWESDLQFYINKFAYRK